MHLALIGYRGSGKSALGKRLSEKLKLPFLDTDARIVDNCGCSIPEIFRDHGEDYFRMKESEVIAGLKDMGDAVVSTGGGAVLREENRHALRTTSYCVYLTAAPEVLFERIKGDGNRPALTALPPMEEVRKLLAVRDPLYRETAHLVVDTGTRDIGTCENIIIEAYASGGNYDR